MIRKLLFLIALLVGFTFFARVAQALPAMKVDGGRALVAVSLRSESDSGRFKSSELPLFAHLVGERDSYFITGTDAAGQTDLAGLGLEFQILDPDLDSGRFYIAYVMPDRPVPAWERFGSLLLEDGFFLLRAAPSEITRLAEFGVEFRALSFDPKPFPGDTVALDQIEAIDPDPVIQTMIDQVDSSTVYTYTGGLSGEWPVTIGGAPYTIVSRNTYSGQPIQKAVEFVGEHLGDLGLAVEYHQWGGASYPNVIGERQGSLNPDDVFIISAHLDDMPTSPVAPGADDNASGSAAVLIAADILTQYQWGCTLRFALFTGEEQALLGSKVYAQRAYNNSENILGVLNLDMIGWNSPLSSRDIDLHANASLPQTLVLAQLFSDVVAAYNLDLIPQIVPNGTGFSDHASFWQYGYSAILGIEDFGDFNPYYHTTQDQLDKLDLSYYTEFVKASVGTFAHLSDCLIPGQPSISTWDKQIWIGESGPYLPMDSPFGVGSEEVVTIVDQVSITATGAITFTLSEAWDDALYGVGWETGSGTVISGTNSLVWSVEGGAPGVSHTITKTYQVSPGNWITGSLTETLWVEGENPQHDPIEISFEHLWPEIVVTPGIVQAIADLGEIVTETLTIENVGGASLDWNISEIPPTAWLVIDPAFGVTAPDDKDNVVLILDADGLARGLYGMTLTINSNDPINPHTDVMVIFAVDPWMLYLPSVLR